MSDLDLLSTTAHIAAQLEAVLHHRRLCTEALKNLDATLKQLKKQEISVSPIIQEAIESCHLQSDQNIRAHVGPVFSLDAATAASNSMALVHNNRKILICLLEKLSVECHACAAAAMSLLESDCTQSENDRTCSVKSEFSSSYAVCEMALVLCSSYEFLQQEVVLWHQLGDHGRLDANEDVLDFMVEATRIRNWDVEELQAILQQCNKDM